MADIHWKVSKFNEYERCSLYQKIRRGLQGKNQRNFKHKKIVTVFSVRIFDAEQYIISSFQHKKNVLVGHFVDIGLSLLMIIKN